MANSLGKKTRSRQICYHYNNNQNKQKNNKKTCAEAGNTVM